MAAYGRRPRAAPPASTRAGSVSHMVAQTRRARASRRRARRVAASGSDL